MRSVVQCLVVTDVLKRVVNVEDLLPRRQFQKTLVYRLGSAADAVDIDHAGGGIGIGAEPEGVHPSRHIVTTAADRVTDRFD